MQFYSYAPQQTYDLAFRIGQAVPAGTIFALNGPLGAGKTHFCQGLAQGLGIREHITSPTFTLINEYEGRLPFYHMDMYRISAAGEFLELGLEEYFAAPGVIAVEWAAKLASYLPAEHIAIDFVPDEEDPCARILRFTAPPVQTAWLEEVLADAHLGH